MAKVVSSKRKARLCVRGDRPIDCDKLFLSSRWTQDRVCIIHQL